jgi:hypothetical protein
MEITMECDEENTAYKLKFAAYIRQSNAQVPRYAQDDNLYLNKNTVIPSVARDLFLFCTHDQIPSTPFSIRCSPHAGRSGAARGYTLEIALPGDAL